jgi:hypothetical protein
MHCDYLRRVYCGVEVCYIQTYECFKCGYIGFCNWVCLFLWVNRFWLWQLFLWLLRSPTRLLMLILLLRLCRLCMFQRVLTKTTIELRICWRMRLNRKLLREMELSWSMLLFFWMRLPLLRTPQFSDACTTQKRTF